jgi:hypothetical protein
MPDKTAQAITAAQQSTVMPSHQFIQGVWLAALPTLRDICNIPNVTKCFPLEIVAVALNPQHEAVQVAVLSAHQNLNLKYGTIAFPPPQSPKPPILLFIFPCAEAGGFSPIRARWVMPPPHHHVQTPRLEYWDGQQWQIV